MINEASEPQEDESRPAVAGELSPVERAGRFVRRQSKRFTRAPWDPNVHEERGVGWRASWREGAERLVLQREPVTKPRQGRFVPRAH